VPRFIVVKTEITPYSRVALVAPNDTRQVQPQNLVEAPLPPLEAHQNEQPVVVVVGERPSLNINSFGPLLVARVEGTETFITEQETRDVTGTCLKPCPPDKPLLLIKWPDRCAAHIGDVVTFFLKYSNHGGQPITDVAVEDSLTTRLEYVEGSARSDRDASFTTRTNEAGSRLLRWEIGGRLLPGQSGVVSFQVRVR
jgi:uncharacterized repeat protein (TIGR01451 family)